MGIKFEKFKKNNYPYLHIGKTGSLMGNKNIFKVGLSRYDIIELLHKILAETSLHNSHTQYRELDESLGYNVHFYVKGTKIPLDLS